METTGEIICIIPTAFIHYGLKEEEDASWPVETLLRVQPTTMITSGPLIVCEATVLEYLILYLRYPPYDVSCWPL